MFALEKDIYTKINMATLSAYSLTKLFVTPYANDS